MLIKIKDFFRFSYVFTKFKDFKGPGIFFLIQGFLPFSRTRGNHEHVQVFIHSNNNSAQYCTTFPL